jgi:hypothetical protein
MWAIAKIWKNKMDSREIKLLMSTANLMDDGLHEGH